MLSPFRLKSFFIFMPYIFIISGVPVMKLKRLMSLSPSNCTDGSLPPSAGVLLDGATAFTDGRVRRRLINSLVRSLSVV